MNIIEKSSNGISQVSADARLTDRLETIAGQMTNVFTHGGREND